MSNINYCSRSSQESSGELSVYKCFTLEFYKEFFQNIPDMLTLVDIASGKILNCNERFLQKLGYNREEISNLNLFLEIYHPDSFVDLSICQTEIKQHGFTNSKNLYLKAKNGHKIPISVNAFTISHDNPEITLACEVYRDMTEVIEGQQKLKSINEELHKRNEELNTLLHLISHDLKSPLRGINLISQWLIEDEYKNLSRSSQRYLESLQQRVNRAEALLEDCTQYFFQPQSNHTLEEVTLNFIDEEFNNRIYIPVGFQIILEGSPTHFYTKKTPLMIILCNLVDNAIKHHHHPYKGKVTIRVSEEDLFYIFSVSDNGPGIDPIHHEYIFGFLNKLQPKDKVEGSGLGLAIVKKLVASEGGNITLESKEGQGATFTFSWPKWQQKTQA